ncbi:MAG: SPOR domain-containing protein [Bacteroidota bacterium]
MLNEYVKELIASNNRVIIPNFGAFLLRATSKNKNKKDLASKIDDIYFSPFLKFNDELLVNHIMKKEDLDQKKSLEKINDYIKTIEDSVSKEGSFKIEGLGEFYQDAQGKVQFRVNPSSEGGKEAKSTEKKPEETKGKTSKTEADKTAKKTVHEKAAASNKKESSKPQPSKAKEEEPKKETPQEPTKKQDKQKTTPPKADKKPTTPASSSTASGGAVTSSEKKKSNKGLVLSIAIGLPIAAIFVWAMLNFDTVKDIFSSKDKTEQPVTEKVEEGQTEEEGKESEETEKEQSETDQAEKSEEQADEQEQTEADKKEKTEASSSEGKKFYIVAGSFRKKQNAVNFRDKLQEQGYNSELIGERNDMHAVSYSSFDSKAKAEAELNMLRKKGIQAWLLYH